MKKIVIILLFLSCKGGVHQEVLLSNKTNGDVYFIIHKEHDVTVSDIKQIRPMDDSEILEYYSN